MENFANFIVNYIEKTTIHGVKGWLPQLQAYMWRTNIRTEQYSHGILTTRKFLKKTQEILNIPKNDDKWHRHCEDIRKWGGIIKEVPLPLALDYKNSVNFLLSHNPPSNNDFTKVPICGKRIATASKIYYYSDPFRWTIYDSRVAYTIHQLLFEYAKTLEVLPISLFPDLPMCLPDSKTNRRNPVFHISRCSYSEKKSRASFIWASYLHRLIARELNKTIIQNPSHYLSVIPQWELPHVEMVFFVIGDRKWIDVGD